MDNTKNASSIEDKYTQMDAIDHVLNKPAVYIGNRYSESMNYNLYKPSENMIVLTEKVGYNAGLLKLFDEILTNPVDERRRSSRNFDINNIEVNVNTDGTICIRDDGGIPVVEHKGLKMMLPKMLFGNMNTSSNYTEEREGAGTNGLGAKLTNIYSLWFHVTTCDGKSHMSIRWKNNMREIEHEVVRKATKEDGHFTKIEFKVDLKRFESMEKFELSDIRIMQKRCIDACAANPGLAINFVSNIAEGKLDKEWKFNSFKEFVSLHLTPEKQAEILEYTTNRNDHIVLLPSIGYNFGFVNGAVCSDGTHIRKVTKKITERIKAILLKKDMSLITDKDIQDYYNVFVSTQVKNPDYDSQTKIKLTSPIPEESLVMSKAFIESIESSVIIEKLIEFFEMKYSKAQKKLLADMNKEIKKTKSKKFTACSNRNDKEQNELFLFEGKSAANGFATHGNPYNQACYELRGKIKNTLNLTKKEIFDNIELREVISILNLQFNEAQLNVKNCSFGKIVIATDMDHDGSHICGLFITFMAKHFPELLLTGKVYRLISPFVIASKGDPEKGGIERFFYTAEEVEMALPTLKGWDIAYKKGLGSLEDRHYEEMLNNPRLMQFRLRDKNYLEVVETWFDTNTKLRKEILMEAGDGGVMVEDDE